MLIGNDVEFKVKNFKSEQVTRIQSEWTSIKDCIIETLKLIRGRFGINHSHLLQKMQ